MKKAPTITLLFGDERVELIPLVAPEKWKTSNECIDHILNGGHFNPLLNDPALPQIRDRWRSQLKAAIQTPPITNELLTAFHTQWHVCHHFFRKLVDDDDLLIDMLWAWLPRYQGPERVLYRGENIDRFEAGRIGTAWSDKEDTAEIFARGLNAVGKGGVVLRATVPASVIIAGPSKHSLYLGESEFTIDIRKTIGFEAVIRFPPSH